MTNLQTEVLKYIKTNHNVICSEVINNLKHLEEAKVIENVIKNFIQSGDIKSSNTNDLTSSHLYLTPRGTITYLHEVEEIERVRKENKRYWITTSIAIIGAITGIISLVWKILEYLTQLPTI